MKYLRFVFLAAYLIGLVIFWWPNTLAILWMSIPVLLVLSIEILILKGKIRSRAIPIVGIVVLALAIPVYYEDSKYLGIDAQAGLASGLVPLSQLFILFLVVVFVGIDRHAGMAKREHHD